MSLADYSFKNFIELPHQPPGHDVSAGMERVIPKRRRPVFLSPWQFAFSAQGNCQS